MPTHAPNPAPRGRRNAHVPHPAALLIALIVASGVPNAMTWAQNTSAATPAVVATDSVIRTRVDSLFDAWRGTDRPGCAVGLSHRGRVVVERGYGMANLESGAPMTPGTVVHAASLAKSVTALGVLLLVRDGKLTLDDDIRRYLPELPAYGTRDAKPITVRHLLNHTSGLRDFFELLILARGRFEEDRITNADAMAVVNRQQALNFPPGTQYGYSNTNYLLAARIIERISGQPFRVFTAQRIFAPLGMTHTHFRDDFAAIVPGRAVGYSRRGSEWRTSIPNYDVVGPTNLLTTVGDLLKWAGNFARPVVGDSTLVRQMLAPTVVSEGDTAMYGFGLALREERGVRFAEHEGRDPGFRAYLGWFQEPGLTVALLCNATALDPVGLGRKVAWIALGLSTDQPRQLQSPSSSSAVDAQGALPWSGVYFEPSTLQVAELTVRDGVLYTGRMGGARVEAINEKRARLVGEPLELEFRDGQRAGYVVRWLIPGRRADAFEWRAAIAPALGRAALAEYAGSYFSREIESTYRVEAGDSTLTLRAGTTPGLVARPVFPDAFVSGQFTIQFIRKGGRVTGFTISHPRARGVEFMR